ncbi:MAG: TetR/AcrR family transcriptional regulator [Clostridia bacterium]|nr:TetR/AcrR family transcriptional regulator [Clostridia bacterium]
MKNNEEARLETRNCIKSALIALLKQTKYEDIRMTDIIRKSGVSRMGVYNNYKTKDEIMLDLYQRPLEEVFFTLNDSIYSNIEWIFKTAHTHKTALKTLIDAGLAHTFLDMMNARFENASKSFYIPIWNGLLYNCVIEWVKSGTDEPVESAVARMKDALKLFAEAVETGETNPTQNAKIK